MKLWHVCTSVQIFNGVVLYVHLNIYFSIKWLLKVEYF